MALTMTDAAPEMQINGGGCSSKARVVAVHTAAECTKAAPVAKGKEAEIKSKPVATTTTT